MINSSNMNGMTEYGADSAYKTLPTGSAWSDGVVPEKTLPAAWWNAILGLFSKNLNQSKLNLDNIVAELNNILSINSTTPNPAATDQLKTFINNFLRNADNLSAGTVPQARLSAAILLTLLKTVDGSGSGLDADTVDGSHYNANDILAKLLTVDGTGSGLDADLLDGAHRSVFMQKTQLTITDFSTIDDTTLNNGETITFTTGYQPNDRPPAGNYYTGFITRQGAGYITVVAFTAAPTCRSFIRQKAAGAWGAWADLWNGLNDGSGSGLDADLLDGMHANRFVFGSDGYGQSSVTNCNDADRPGFYRLEAPFTNSPETPATAFFVINFPWGGGVDYILQIAFRYNGGTSYFRSKTPSGWGNWNKIWNSANDGSGSGLDADLLDGLDSTRFAVAWRDLITGDVLATMNKSGMYVSISGSTNAPSSGTYCYFTNYYDSNTAVSIAVNAISGTTFMNRKTGGTWLGWVKLWSELNDGSGSGLDADTVDGIQAVRLLYGDNDTGSTSMNAGFDLNNIIKTGVYTGGSGVLSVPVAGKNNFVLHLQFAISEGAAIQIWWDNQAPSLFYFRTKTVGTWSDWRKLWNEGNDGSGSGLDADLLDGRHWSDLFTLDGRAKQLKPVFGMCGQVGSGLAISGTDYPAITALNSTDIALIDGGNDSLRTYRWNGSTWSQVGSGLTISGVGLSAITALNSTDIAFIDGGNRSLRTYRWNGSTWSQVGSGLTISGVSYSALAALNSTDIAFIDNIINSLRTYRWNGSTWSQVGSGLTISGVGYIAITALNSTDIAFIDGGNRSLRTYRWNGSTWSQVGSGLTISGVSYSALAALNSTDIALIDGGNDSLRTYRWNGTMWSQVGSGLSISNTDWPAITALNSTDIAFIDGGNRSLSVYAFN